MTSRPGVPYDDFDVNAGGTLNVLETTRVLSPEAVFVFMSTNKVYGDAPNELPLKELPRRWDYAREEDFAGIPGGCASTHRSTRYSAQAKWRPM